MLDLGKIGDLEDFGLRAPTAGFKQNDGFGPWGIEMWVERAESWDGKLGRKVAAVIAVIYL